MKFCNDAAISVDIGNLKVKGENPAGNASPFYQRSLGQRWRRTHLRSQCLAASGGSSGYANNSRCGIEFAGGDSAIG
jgi:hypothetical protein